MESLFNTEVSDKFIRRINNLSPESKANWGKMTVSQMLAHAQKTFLTAAGEIKLKRSFISYLFGPIARRKLLDPKPFIKNLPTAPEFIIRDQRDFEMERKKLIELILKYRSAGPEGVSKDPHPFFGKMTIDEWEGLLYKHLDHHLRQFGV